MRIRRRRVWLVLLEVVRVAVMHHRALRSRVLEGRGDTRVLNDIQHRIEEVRADGDVAISYPCHRVFRRVVLLGLLALRLLRLRVVANQDAIA